MSSLNPALIRDVSRSWLYFLNTALAAQNIPFVNQASASRALDLPDTGVQGYVVVGPATEWRIAEEKLEVAFQLRTVTRQRNGDGLSAYEANLALQIAVNTLLFHPNRYLSGFSTGQGDLYGLPLWTFNADSTPAQEIDAHALTYSSQPHWIARNALEADQVVWTLDLQLSSS